MCFNFSRAGTIEEQQKIFWDQADFGYLKNFLDGMLDLCKPKKKVVNDKLLFWFFNPFGKKALMLDQP